MTERKHYPGPVVVIGDALIDEVREGRRSRDLVGGAALNVAIGASILGLDATLIAMVGDDEDGEAIRAALARDGVHLISSPSDFGTSRAISDRIDGEPVYFFNRAAQRRRIGFGLDQCAAIVNASAVVVSCFPFDDQKQADDLEDSLAASEAVVIVDANPRSGMLADRSAFIRNFERTVARCQLMKVSNADAELLYGTSLTAVTHRLLGMGARAVLTTNGKDGGGISTRSGVTVRVPIAVAPGAILDTMGAGDATLTSVLHSLLVAGIPDTAEGWRAVLTRAMEVAASTCRQTGGRLRLPTSSRLRELS